MLLADRGFAEVNLRRWCGDWGWRYRLRLKSPFLGYRRGHGSALVEQLLPKRQGKAVVLHHGLWAGQRHGPVPLALARPPGDEAPWLIVSDELPGL